MSCQLCGEKSGFYPLCKNCIKLRDAGKISKCEECGIWKRDLKKLCRECSLKNYNVGDGETVIKSSELTIEENNFRSKYPADFRAEDGHMVRSKAEQIIDNWLYHKGIVHAYERRVPITENLCCDFFIPLGKNIWIEFWGLEDTKYQKRKDLKKRLYAAYKYNLIELTDKDIQNIDDVMPTKLRKYLPSTFKFN